jgi:hypothetical protein
MHQKHKKLKVLLPSQGPTILCALNSTEQESFAFQVPWTMVVVVMGSQEIGVPQVAWILLIYQNDLKLDKLDHCVLIM